MLNDLNKESLNIGFQIKWINQKEKVPKYRRGIRSSYAYNYTIMHHMPSEHAWS